MELSKYKACICEGAAESAILDILVENDLLIFPRSEMLIIHSEGAYGKFKRSRKKPSEFCKTDLRMHEVKSYNFVKSYFQDANILVRAIREYRRTANIPNGEYTLFDLLK